MATVKQVCLGVAVAGVVAGAGAAVGTAVASADPAGSESSSGVDAGPSRTAASSPRTRDDAPNRGGTGTSADADTAGSNAPQRASARDSRTSGAGALNGASRTDSSPSSGAEPADVERRATQSIRTTASKTSVDESLGSRNAARAANVVPDLVSRALQAPQPAPNRQSIPTPLVPTAFVARTSTSADTRAKLVASGATGAAAIDATSQHVLVIGVDGTNLSRVLSNPDNQNFLRLMDTSTTAASSIVGHTTISNPSWTAILTGAWDNKSAVINNVFTADTYDRWPTVYNQLETFDPAIRTKVVADWDVITDIAGAGSIPADDIVLVPQVEGDTNWAQTDAAVTDEAVKSILGTDPGYEDVPNFMFTYLVQVDENGHMFGGASPEYAASIGRTDANLGRLLDAVAAREAATGEDWTIIVVTDHGHQPQQGFGHGFQSPDETSTFVIADGPAFADAAVNLDYEIVDVTPTVVTLFGGIPVGNIDGVPLMSLNGNTFVPADVTQALEIALAANRWPDPLTNLALSLRTIFATIPYYVVDFTGSQNNPLYAVTDILAQVVAQLTGVQVFPPAKATPPQPAPAPDAALAV